MHLSSGSRSDCFDMNITVGEVLGKDNDDLLALSNDKIIDLMADKLRFLNDKQSIVAMLTYLASHAKLEQHKREQHPLREHTH